MIAGTGVWNLVTSTVQQKTGKRAFLFAQVRENATVGTGVRESSLRPG